jgi:hypothetical protein
VCHGGVIEASFYLAFGLGGSAARVSFAVLNTSTAADDEHVTDAALAQLGADPGPEPARKTTSPVTCGVPEVGPSF